ncbi:MAG: cryptochrome/photolyase family protein [Nitrosopumilus sp.]|jgi:deoxyribodipyrimidine photo-lyase
MAKYEKSLFLFRRDLRIEDNTGLINASKFSSEVIPCFIMDSELLKKSSPKFSQFRLQFLNDCLIDLDEELKKNQSHLHIISGNREKLISNIIKKQKIDAIFLNTDYSPFSRKRDREIQKICEKNEIDFVSIDDLLLHDVELLKTGKDEPYKIFTAFYNKARELPIRKPQKSQYSNFSNQEIEYEIPIAEFAEVFGKPNNSQRKGGRKSGIQLLRNVKNLKNYDEERNIPSVNGTSLLSAHNKFGTLSIREIYEKCAKELGPSHTIISELHWRDFFTYLMYHYPQSFSKEYNKRFQNIPWSKNTKAFSKWCDGETGFPIVDAGMRELNETGFMHNRVRMIVASFLTKDLHIDWRWGEKYFATKLIDYDPCVNVGNWQWAASTGCDAQPWFRIFNPWLQQKRFDPDCIYIKKWLPELRHLSPKAIHNLSKSHPNDLSYEEQMVDHSVETKMAKEIFGSAG